MTAIGADLRTHVITSFAPLNSASAANAFPPIATLADTLVSSAPTKMKPIGAVNVPPRVAALFATAAVEMWQRAVHSFLISASLTGTSPLWAAVSGYYSSHYSIRALAHLLGYFQLFRAKSIVRLVVRGGRQTCEYEAKKGDDREHKFYWRTVKADPLFAADSLFTVNDPGIDVSDVAHRDRANYADHLTTFRQFRPLNLAELGSRIDFVSKIEFSTPPIPRVSKCPDVDNTQVIAYHRLIAFRRIVDEILGGRNRFWNVQRDPVWGKDMLNYQLTPNMSASLGLGGS